MKKSLEDAINAPRIHHQLMPMHIIHESNFNRSIIDGLKKLQHKIADDNTVAGYTAITAISRVRGQVEAMFDTRRPGSVAVA